VKRLSVLLLGLLLVAGCGDKVVLPDTNATVQTAPREAATAPLIKLPPEGNVPKGTNN
jgi:hypothetical protein